MPELSKQASDNDQQLLSIITDDDEPNELLSRALKRKFTELDEITQRLRLRLSKVTNEADNDDDNNDAECSNNNKNNDELTDEFERDINTLCVEDDFDMIDFEVKQINDSENQNIATADDNGEDDETTSASSSSVPALSFIKKSTQSKSNNKRSVMDNKQHIDSLLQKLTLLSSASTSIDNNLVELDTEALLVELDHSSRPNIHSTSNFNLDKLYEDLSTASGSSTNSTNNCDNRQNKTIDDSSELLHH